MPGCAVATCNNYTRTTKGSEIKYFRFPKVAELCEKWIIACQRIDKFNINNSYVCSAHFDHGCFKGPSLQERLLNYTAKNKRPLKPDALPTLNIPDRKTKSNDPKRSSAIEKKRKIGECESLNDISRNLDKVKEKYVFKKASDEKTHLKSNRKKINEKKEILKLKEKIQKLEREKLILQNKLNCAEGEIKDIKIMIENIFIPGQVKEIIEP